MENDLKNHGGCEGFVNFYVVAYQFTQFGETKDCSIGNIGPKTKSFLVLSEINNLSAMLDSMLKPQSPQNPIVLINSGFSHQLFVEMLLSCVIQIIVEILFAGNVKDLHEENISQTKTKLISFYFNENQLLLTVVFYHFFTQSQIEPFQRTQEKHSHEPFLINRKRWRGDGSLAKTMRAIFRCCFFLRFVLLVRAFTATFLKTLLKRTATRKRIHRRTLSFF